MHRSIDKQSGESMWSQSWRRKTKAAAGRICRKEGAVHYCKDGKASPAPRSTTMHVHPKSTSNNDETTGLNAHNGRASCSTGHQPVISHDLLGGWSIDVTQRPVRTPGNTSAMCEQQQGLNWGGGFRRISDPAPLIWDPVPLITDFVPHNWGPGTFLLGSTTLHSLYLSIFLYAWCFVQT